MPNRVRIAFAVAIALVVTGCGSKGHFEKAMRVSLPADAVVIAEARKVTWDANFGAYYVKLRMSRGSFLKLVQDLGMRKGDGDDGILEPGLGEGLNWWDPPEFRRQLECKDRYQKWDSIPDEDGRPSSARTVAQFHDGIVYIFKHGYVR